MQEDTIKITSTLDVDFDDLMTDVDLSHEFTLRDIVRAAVSSTHIPLPLMSEILHCPCLHEFWKEMESQPFDNEGDIEYLELSWQGWKSTFDGKNEDSSGWMFDGVGKAGEIPSDLIDNCPKEEIDKMRAEGYRQGYAIEMSPLYKLADYIVRVKDSIHITDYDVDWKNGTDGSTIKLTPSVCLLEVMYNVMWELSFFGNPEQRNQQLESLKGTIDEFKKAKEEGRLDEVSVPWEDVKEKIKKKWLDKEN